MNVQSDELDEDSETTPVQFDILFSAVDEPRNIMKNLSKSPENLLKNLRCMTSEKSLLGFVSC